MTYDDWLTTDPPQEHDELCPDCDKSIDKCACMEPIRVVRCIHCGDYTPGVYEAHHKEMMRKLKQALEDALKQLEATK